MRRYGSVPSTRPRPIAAIHVRAAALPHPTPDLVWLDLNSMGRLGKEHGSVTFLLSN
jgi:hypothetical protein